jgi:MFS family permease
MMRQGLIRSPWVVVAGGFFIMALIHSMIQTCFSLFMIPVMEDMQVNRTAFSLCTGLMAIATTLLAPAMGRWLTGPHAGRLFVGCILGLGLSYASYSLAGSMAQMYISAVFVGAFYCGSAALPVSIILVNWFRRARGLAISISLAGSGVGGAFITPILTNMIAGEGWRFAFMAFGAAIILIEVPVAGLLMKAHPEDIGMVSYGQGSSQADYDEVELDLPLPTLLRQPFFYVYLIGMFAVSFVGYGSLAHLSVYLTETYSPAFSNAIVSFFLLLLTPAKIALGWIYDKLGARLANVIVMSLHAASFLILQVGGGETGMWIMAACFAIGISNGTVAPPVTTAAFFGCKEYGTIFGFVYAFCMMGMVLGSPTLALIYDTTGSYRLAWAACFALSLLTIACMIMAEAGCRRLARTK